MTFDYTLLRDLDKQLLKPGDSIIWKVTGGFVTYLGGPDRFNHVAVELSTVKSSKISLEPASHFCMPPLAWVEGKPVYEGDMLYDKRFSENTDGVVIDGSFGNRLTANERIFKTEELTWTKPKVKKSGWVVLFPILSNGAYIAGTSRVYPSKEEAIKGCCVQELLDVVEVHWFE